MDYSEFDKIGDVKIIAPLKKHPHDWHAAVLKGSECYILGDDTTSGDAVICIERGISPQADDAKRDLLNRMAWHGAKSGRVLVRRHAQSGQCYCYVIDQDHKVTRQRHLEVTLRVRLEAYLTDQMQLHLTG